MYTKFSLKTCYLLIDCDVIYGEKNQVSTDNGRNVQVTSTNRTHETSVIFPIFSATLVKVG